MNSEKDPNREFTGPSHILSSRAANEPLDRDAENARDRVRVTLSVVKGRDSESEARDLAMFDRQVSNAESEFCAQFEVLPQRHPLTQWLYGLMGQIDSVTDDAVLYVMSNVHEPQAFALPNGSIFVSHGLLKFCDHTEELLFILSHEYQHFKNGHSKLQFEKTHKDDLFAAKQFMEIAGLQRFHELESDIRGMLALDKKGLNAYGGIRFFKKLYDKDKFKATVSEPTHGSDLGRTLNLSWVTKLVDLKSASVELTPIPEAVTDEIKKIRRPPFQDISSNRSILWNLPLKIQQSDLSNLKLVLRDLSCLEIRFFNATDLALFKSLVQTASQRLVTLMRRIDPKLSDDTLFLIADLVMAFSTPNGLKREPNGHPAGLQTASFDALTEAIDPLNFDRLEAFCKANPRGLMQELSRRFLPSVLTLEDLNSHLGQLMALSKRIGNLYSEKGLRRVEIDDRWYTEAILELGRHCLANGKISADDFRKAVRDLDIPCDLTGFAPQTKIVTVVAPVSPFRGLLDKSLPDLPPDTLKILDRVFDGEMEDPKAVHEWVATLEPAGLLAQIKHLNSSMSKVDVYMQTEIERSHSDRETDTPYRKLQQHQDRFRSNYKKFTLSLTKHLTKMGILKSAYDQTKYVFECGIAVGYDWMFTDFYSDSTSRSKILIPVHDFDELMRIHDDLLSGNSTFRLSSPIEFSYLASWWSAEHVRLLQKNVKAGVPKAEILDTLRTTVKNVSFDFFGNSDHELRSKFKTLLSTLFKHYPLDIRDPDDAEFLLYLSFFVEDLYLRNLLQQACLGIVTGPKDFESVFELLFPKSGKPIFGVDAIQNLSEKKAVTHSQIESVKGKITSLVSSEHMDYEKVGIYAQFERLVDYKTGKLKTLLACLTAESDLDLKKLLYSCKDMFAHPNDIPDFLRMIYLSDEPMRYALLRMLLVGHHGVLVMSHSRDDLVHYFVDNYVKAPETQNDKTLMNFLKSVLLQMVRKASIEDLYFTIFPLFLRRFLVHPKSESKWQDALWKSVFEGQPNWALYEWQEFLEDHENEEGAIRHMMERISEETGIDFDPRKVKGSEEEEDDDLTYDGDPLACDIDMNEDYFLLRRRANDRLDKEPQFKLVPEISSQVKNEAKAFEDKRSRAKSKGQHTTVLDAIEQAPKAELPSDKLSPIDFVLEIAKNLGSPGIRFLQLLGQYIDLPSEYRAKFDEVYDRIFGQFKPVAHDTILREWPQFKEEISEMRAPIGGGSLMTVYEVITHKGERQVLKVLNPNAEMKTQKIYKLFQQIFEAMGEEYGIALPLIDEIRDWVSKDIRFDGFLEKDKEFFAQNNGFSHNGYSVRVPHSFGPENRYFKREDFIDGHNLTQWDTLASNGHDLKAIASLITKNFLEQISRGLVHSDVHPGNFRVTADREVAILDRNYFLEFSMEERTKLFEAFGPLVTCGFGAGFAHSVIGIFCKTEEGYDPDFLAGKLNIELGTVDPGRYTDIINKTVIFLKERGINVPIKYTLLIKNLLALDQLCRKAGFAGIHEAVLP